MKKEITINIIVDIDEDTQEEFNNEEIHNRLLNELRSFVRVDFIEMVNDNQDMFVTMSSWDINIENV